MQQSFGPEPDFQRLKELGFEAWGFQPAPDEGSVFRCPRSGWKIGVPYLAGPYYVYPYPQRPHFTCSTLDEAVSKVRSAPTLPPRDPPPPGNRGSGSASGRSRKPSRPEPDSEPPVQSRSRPPATASGAAEAVAIGPGRAKLSARKFRRGVRSALRLLIMLAMLIPLVMVLEYLAVLPLSAVPAAFFTPVVDRLGWLTALLAIAGTCWGIALWSWMSWVRALVIAGGALGLAGVTWLGYDGWLRFPAVSNLVLPFGAAFTALLLRTYRPPTIGVAWLPLLAGIGFVVGGVFAALAADQLPSLPDDRAIWLAALMIHGAIAAFPAIEIAISPKVT